MGEPGRPPGLVANFLLCYVGGVFEPGQALLACLLAGRHFVLQCFGVVGGGGGGQRLEPTSTRRGLEVMRCRSDEELCGIRWADKERREDKTRKRRYTPPEQYCIPMLSLRPDVQDLCVPPLKPGFLYSLHASLSSHCNALKRILPPSKKRQKEKKKKQSRMCEKPKSKQ